MNRRDLLLGLAAAALPLGHAGPVSAAEWPKGTIQVLVGFPVGGIFDILNRAIIGEMQAKLGVQMISVPTPGAGSILALQKVMQAGPDGNTLLLMPTPALLARPLQMGLPISYKDVTVLGTVARSDTFICVGETNPWKTLEDLIAAAKAAPEKYSYATSGVGGIPHLGMAELSRLTGIRLVQVTYPGSPPAILSVVGGQNDIVVTDVDNPGIRALANLSEGRSSFKPDVPTLKELGYDFGLSARFILVGPKGLPAEIAARLEKEFAAAAATPAVRDQLAKLKLDVLSESPGQLMPVLEREAAVYDRLIHSLGLAHSQKGK